MGNLDDPLATVVNTTQDNARDAFWVELIIELLALSWLFCIFASRNLRLWSRALFTASMLACFSGFLAWATALPNPAGIDECERRLGSAGVMYYREVASHNGFSVDVLLDGFLSEV